MAKRKGPKCPCCGSTNTNGYTTRSVDVIYCYNCHEKRIGT